MAYQSFIVDRHEVQKMTQVVKPLGILAIDVGAKMGLAVVIGGVVTNVKFVHFKGERVDRQRNLLLLLTKLAVDMDNLDVVAYERPFCRGTAATRSLLGMVGLIEAVGSMKCAVLDQEPKTIKLWATGSGNATKEQMKVEARYRLAVQAAAHLPGAMEPRDLNEHEADAVLLGLYVHATARRNAT